MPIPESQKTKQIAKNTGHGFQEFASVDDLQNFFRADPTLEKQDEIKKPKKPSSKQNH